MPIGVILLTITGVLIFFGLAERVLDRMRLSDKAALAFIGAMIVGSFPIFNFTIVRQPELSFNLGGGIIPLVLVLYLIFTADETREKVRGIVGAVITAAVVFGISFLLPDEPTERRQLIDPIYMFSIVAGVVGYISGRSRRASFIAGAGGVLLNDIGHFVQAIIKQSDARTFIGGAGGLDTIVVAGVLAVLLAEIFGEGREFLQGGPKAGPGRPEGLTIHDEPGKQERDSGDSPREEGKDRG